MKTRNTILQTAVGAALLSALGPAAAAEGEDVFALTKPESNASIGLGYADSDGRRFGQYNGVNERGAYGLLDMDLVRRDDETGTWLRFNGRNLGLDNRQFRFEHNRQGNWGYFIEGSQIPRYEPYVATTAVTGITTPDLVIPATPTPGVPVDLKTRRDVVGLGFDKFLSREWDVKVRYRNEEKEGARLWARGTTGTVAGFAGNFEFAPEPINSTTRQLEATLGFNGEKLQLSGGYYGTMYNNQYNQLNFTGGVAALSTFNPIALPPDNNSHQLYLSGGYGFTPTTRGTFKVAYAKAQQDDAFPTGVNVPLAPGIGNNLQGRVDTTQAQAGITSRPMPKLSLRADVRYEDRDDKTPVLRYNTLATATSTFNGDNEPRSIRTTSGRVEASYALPMAFRVTGGIEYDEKKRNISAVRVVSARETTDETSYRVELRRPMSETVTGALSYVHSERDGSPFLQTVVNDGSPGSNLIAPVHLADRKRDKVRLSVNWTPMDPLTIQLFVDEARDEYTGRDGLALGPRTGEAHNYSLDISYAFSDKWQATAWYSRNDTKAEQATCENASAVGVCPASAADPIWKANLRNVSDSVGAGLRGKPSGKLLVGLDVNYTDISDTYGQVALSPSTSTVPTALPDVSTKLTRVNLYGKYALQKNSGVRIDYIYDRFSTNDWTWTTWQYLDGTVISQDPVQEVHFVGVSYYLRWR